MGSEGVPDEYVDSLVQEFAYDPIRLPVKEDPVQMLYDRTTLERIWDAKHDAVNPYTRQPFDISNAIPQAELRQQMSQYILENKTLTLTQDLEVIPEYTKVVSTTYMKNLLNELSFRRQVLDLHCSTKAIAEEKTGSMDEKKYWKALWKKLNLLRLHFQYRAENRVIFSSNKGYEYLFMIIDEPLLNLSREYNTLCDYAKEVCIEAARIVDIIDLKDSDLRALPESSVWAFVHILIDLAGSEYLKIQSLVLRIFHTMFFECISYLIGGNIFCNCVVDTVISLLLRRNAPGITNEDLYNGSATLKAGWIRNSSLVLDHEDYVDVLVQVVIICISRFESLHAAAVRHAHPSSDSNGRDQAKNIYIISMALDQGLSLIDSLVTDYSNDSYNYVDQRERLQSLDIVKEIVRMVELVLSGFRFMEPSHFRFGFNIARALYKRGGHSVIRRNDVEVFKKLLRSNNVDGYGKQVKMLLEGIMCEADAVTNKRIAHVNRRPGNRRFDVRNGRWVQT